MFSQLVYIRPTIITIITSANSEVMRPVRFVCHSFVLSLSTIIAKTIDWFHWNSVLRVGYTIVYSRLWYNLLISWPSCYGQHGPTNSVINWSRFSGVSYGTLFHSRHCREIGDKSRSWNDTGPIYQSELLTFGGDPVPDHFLTSLTIAESGILEHFLPFLIQSPADFHDTPRTLPRYHYY